MNKDRAGSSADKIAGSIKEAIGKVTGDTGLQAAGYIQKSGVIVNDAAGDIKKAGPDTVRE